MTGFNRIVSPFLTAFNSMPRIALGPLFILWFGIGIASKVVLAFSLGYFIMLLSTLGGLKNVDRDLLLMSRLFGASELRLFRHVRLPWALPGIFAGLRLTLIYCSAGAVIGEMIAARSGLGLLVQTFSGRFDVAGVMALILVVAFMVMALTSLMDFARATPAGMEQGQHRRPLDEPRESATAKGPRRTGVRSPYSDPIRAPFSATERFISSTTNTSATMTTASTQNTSK